MNTHWLTIQSFQHSQQLLDAINTLSIHTKLELAAIADERRTEAAAKAREVLVSFLKSLKEILHENEGAKDRPSLGVDPRLKQLARSFCAAKSDRQRFQSVLFTKTVSGVIELLGSADRADKDALVESLGELRILVEEHLHLDASRILGGI